MRRPRNPLPPNTVTRRQDMAQKYRAALGYAILFSALPEAKQASAQARKIRRVTSSDEIQAGARPSFASGTERRYGRAARNGNFVAASNDGVQRCPSRTT